MPTLCLSIFFSNFQPPNIRMFSTPPYSDTPINNNWSLLLTKTLSPTVFSSWSCLVISFKAKRSSVCIRPWNVHNRWRRALGSGHQIVGSIEELALDWNTMPILTLIDPPLQRNISFYYFHCWTCWRCCKKWAYFCLLFLIKCEFFNWAKLSVPSDLSDICTFGPTLRVYWRPNVR